MYMPLLLEALHIDEEAQSGSSQRSKRRAETVTDLNGTAVTVNCINPRFFLRIKVLPLKTISKQD